MGRRGPRPDKGKSRDRIGNVEIYKGSTQDGVSVVQWDAITVCEEESCNIYTVCPYNKVGKCRVRSEYLDHVHTIMHGQINSDMKLALFRLGMELIPLFNQLIDIKIAAYGCTTVIATKHGWSVNPIMRELRACIKGISDTLGSLTNMGAFDKGGPKGTDTVLGNSDYYDKLFTEGPVKEEFKMRNRP